MYGGVYHTTLPRDTKGQDAMTYLWPLDSLIMKPMDQY